MRSSEPPWNASSPTVDRSSTISRTPGSARRSANTDGRMSGVRPRVLLVDDVADLRFLLRVVLEADGMFEVVGEAGDGETAVDLCARTDPDVVLLDLSMPTMDGLEALPRLRALAPDAKIVVLSAFERGRVSSSAADLGADAYFEKGTPPPTVLDGLKDLL